MTHTDLNQLDRGAFVRGNQERVQTRSRFSCSSPTAMDTSIGDAFLTQGGTARVVEVLLAVYSVVVVATLAGHLGA